MLVFQLIDTKCGEDLLEYWYKSISEYKKAIDSDPDYAEAYNNLGNAYLIKGEPDKAITTYKKAVAIRPDYANAHNNLAVTYCSKGNYESAIIHCDKAVALGRRVNPELLELLKSYR